MKETGSPCKPWEIKAFLDGRKTAFVRPVKTMKAEKIVYGKSEGMINLYKLGKYYFPDLSGLNISEVIKHGPHGTTGDLIFMKETWKVGAWRNDGRVAIDYIASPEITNTPWINPPSDDYLKIEHQSLKDCWKSDIAINDSGRFTWDPGQSPCRTRPSIHMPKWAARIWMEITDVRVKRVQDITDHEVLDLGFRGGSKETSSGSGHFYTPRDAFVTQWESHCGDWTLNPYVWIYDLKRINYDRHRSER